MTQQFWPVLPAGIVHGEQSVFVLQELGQTAGAPPPLEEPVPLEDGLGPPEELAPPLMSPPEPADDDGAGDAALLAVDVAAVASRFSG